MSSTDSDIDDGVLKKYEILQFLGEGVSVSHTSELLFEFIILIIILSCHNLQGFGKVWMALDHTSSRIVALKKISRAFESRRSARNVYQEIMLLKAFERHKNVISVLDVLPAHNFEDIYLVLQLMGKHIFYCHYLFGFVYKQ